MKNYLIFSYAIISLIFISCSSQKGGNAKNNLSAAEFSAKIQVLSSAPIIDVRTPEEFSKGHLLNAKNFNWTGDDFDNQMVRFDKSEPVFVYCLSGGRSSEAAEHLRSEGFKEVYELEGGIMKWRGAGLPENSDSKIASEGMTRQQFDDQLDNEKLVLIDFYADWCAPCQKMKPYLEEITKEMADRVIVIRINADDNSELCKVLKIDALPVLLLYRNKTLVWKNEGFINKVEVIKKLN